MTKPVSTGELRESLMLWLPTGTEEIEAQTLDNFWVARQAVDDFLDLKISPQTYVETLYGCGVEIDSYLDDVSHNLIYL